MEGVIKTMLSERHLTYYNDYVIGSSKVSLRTSSL